MKRSRKSTKKHAREEHTHHHHHHHQESVEEMPGGASVSDAASGEILINIFSRLSVKSIFRCRCVCKLWLKLLSTPDFAKSHFSRAPACPLIRESGERNLARALYLIEFERDSMWDVGDKSCGGGMGGFCHDFHMGRCHRHVDMELRTIFMLPERAKTKILERRFDIVNSCNGLLCLTGCRGSFTYPVVIYNPVTGEYSALPNPEYNENEMTWMATVAGLGFCPKTNQYKVLVITMEGNLKRLPGIPVKYMVALIYTLGGLGGWRKIGNAPFSPRYGKSCPVFMNGALHWLVQNGDDRHMKLIVTFDFEGEVFRALPSIPDPDPNSFLRGWIKEGELPQLWHQSWTTRSEVYDMGLGVISGHLYMCDYGSDHPFHIWAMKDYGVKESWVLEYDSSRNRESGIFMTKDEWWEMESLVLYQPIDFLSNGDLLMYHDSTNAVICIDKQNSFRLFTIGNRKGRVRSGFTCVAHVPSFVSLKDIIGDTLAVLNVRLSGPRKKFGERLFLVEGNRRRMLDKEFYYYN